MVAVVMLVVVMFFSIFGLIAVTAAAVLDRFTCRLNTDDSEAGLHAHRQTCAVASDTMSLRQSLLEDNHQSLVTGSPLRAQRRRDERRCAGPR